MNQNLLLIFIVLNIVNVIIQTVKSIATIKCGKFMASLVNALAYGLYTVVLVYTQCDLPLMIKAGIVAMCNLIGVYVVKWVEEKSYKDKLWKVELTVSNEETEVLHEVLTSKGVPHNYIPNIGKHTMFQAYCATQKESMIVKELAIKHKAKFFASESKVL